MRSNLPKRGARGKRLFWIGGEGRVAKEGSEVYEKRRITLTVEKKGNTGRLLGEREKGYET